MVVFVPDITDASGYHWIFQAVSTYLQNGYEEPTYFYFEEGYGLFHDCLLSSLLEPEPIIEPHRLICLTKKWNNDILVRFIDQEWLERLLSNECS